MYRLIDRASPALERIERRAAAADRQIAKLGRTMDKIAARAEVQKLAGLAGGMDKVEKSTGRVERVMAKTGVTARATNRELDKTSTTSKKVTSDMGRLETAMRKVLVVGGGLGKVFGTLFGAARLGGMAALVQPAIGAIQALGAGAIALVAQAGRATGAIVPMIARLGDLAGVGAAAATVMLSIKAAALVTKFAMNGVTQAIHGNVAAFKLLTPQARAFVLEMRKLQPLMNTIRRSAQTGLFTGLRGAVQTARQNGAFQAANQAAGGIGGAVGGLAQRAASQLLSPAVLRDLVNLSGTAQVVITRLGGAAVNLGQAFIGILVAAQPLTRWLVSTIDHWSKYLLQQVQIGRATGSLTRYFEGTRRTLTVLGHAVRDFGMGFLNIMRVARGQTAGFGTGLDRIAKTFRAWTSDFSNQARIALWFQRAQASAHQFRLILTDTLRIFMGLGKASQSLGTTMVGGIEKTMRRWATWTNSFKGQNALSVWFSTARVTLAAMWKLLSDIGGAFNRLGMQGGGAANLLTTIDKLVPDLERVLRTFGQQLGPGLFQTVAQLAHLLATITAAGGSPLGMMLSMTAGILTNVNHILDRFHMVRTAVAIAVTAIGGALLLRKLAGIAGGVSVIAAMWAKVTGNTIAAGEAAAGVEAITRGGVATGMGRAGAAAARTGSGAYAGPFSGVGVVGGGAAAGAARTGIRGMLASPRFGLGVGLALPVLGGIGAQALAGQGVISQGSANTASGVLGGAGSGAMLGSMLGPWGMAGGAIIGGAAGFLGSSGSGGPSPRDRYLASLARTAAHTGTGFDINQMQGGAQTLAQANQFQRVLDQSLEGLQRRRNAIAPTSRLSVAQAAASAPVGGVFAQAHALDQQIAANQSLRHLNISRLGVERATLATQKAQTAELAKQARERAGTSLAAKVGGQYMDAFNVYRKAGWSVDRATHQVVGDMESRAARSKNPAFALGLAKGGTAWLAQMKKVHPELKTEYDNWNKTLKRTLDRMGVTIVTSGDTVLKATGKQWGQIRDAIAQPAEVAKERVTTAFTQLQLQAQAILVGMGVPASKAASIVAGGDAGGALPTIAQVTGGRSGGMNPGRTGRMPTRATGGRIPGVGLQDTVPLGGAMAAPGELVVNRHTEARVNGLLGRVGTSLGALVAGEHRGHAQGFQRGGRTGATIGGIVNSGNLGRTDMGVDFTGAGGVPAFADGVVTRVDQLNTGNSGWPGPRGPRSGGFVNYRVTSGPARGRYIYVAENLTPSVTVGQHIRAGQRIATAHGASPFTEMGWSAAPNGMTLAHATTGYREGQVTNAGQSFLSFLNLNGGNSVPLTGGGGGGARRGGALGPGVGNMLMPGLDYSMFGAGLGGLPMAASLQVGNLIAAGLQGRINRRLSSGSAATMGTRAGPRMGGGTGAPMGGGTAGQNQQLAQRMMLAAGWGMGEWPPLQKLWTRESGFNTTATGSMTNLGRAYGIPQSLPGNKMATAGPDWKTNPATQIRWGLGYIRGRYHSPSAAWAHSESHNPHWYAKGGRIPEWGGWHAGGLDRTFDRPTMIGVGEKGREHVSVTPSGASGGRSGTVNIGEIHIHGGDVAEIRKELDQWAEDLARMLERQPIVEG